VPALGSGRGSRLAKQHPRQRYTSHLQYVHNHDLPITYRQCSSPQTAAPAMGDYKVGQTILSQDGRQGIIRFIGTGSFAAGEWIGLELPDSSGKNDGSVKGERYFNCLPGHGIFIRREAVERVIKQPTPAANGRPPTKPVNGAAARSRPLNGITTDQARRRQSLMGSGSAPGSRLSMRVFNCALATCFAMLIE